MEVKDLDIDIGRLLRRLDLLSRIGAKPDGTICRLAATPEDKLARDQLVKWMVEDGLDVHVDKIGNVVGILGGPGEDAILIGSHIDTVTTGGKYDGVLGVLAGLA